MTDSGKVEYNRFLRRVTRDWSAWINSVKQKHASKAEEKANNKIKRKIEELDSETVSQFPSSPEFYSDFDIEQTFKETQDGLWKDSEEEPWRGQGQREVPQGQKLKGVRRRLHSTVHRKLAMQKVVSSEILNLERLGVAETQVHNITKLDIPKEQMEALAYGINFIPVPDLDKSVISDAMTKFKRTVRLRWKHRLHDESQVPDWYIPNQDWNPPQAHPYLEKCLLDLGKKLSMSKDDLHSVNWSPEQKRHLKELLNNKELLVITADKNLGYVICTTTWYKQAVEAHLSDSKMYEDVTDKFQNQGQGQTLTEQCFHQLENIVQEFQSCLTAEAENWILQGSNFKPMKFYITAKVHKTPFKGRPIAPAQGWVTFHLSEYIAAELNQYKKTLSTVLKDSTQFVNELESLSLKTKKSKPDQIWLVGLDITAMYPNLDIQLGLQLIKTFLDEVKYKTPRHREFLLRAMEFTLTEGYLKWENKIYRQRNGAAMGSPFSPPYADIFMYMLERVYIDQEMIGGTLLLYKRYLDDVFAVINGSYADAKAFVKGMNELEPETIELTGSISKEMIFLDVTVHWNHRTHTLVTQVYQKPMNKYPYLPWKSFHTKGMKKGFIKGEAIRYARLSTRKRNFKYLVNLFILRLMKRGYPLSFIRKALSSVEWEKRSQYLTYKTKDTHLPLLFPIHYNPAPSKKDLRKYLDAFTEDLDNWKLTPSSLKGKITISYSLPPKLHRQVLKSRASKGF